MPLKSRCIPRVQRVVLIKHLTATKNPYRYRGYYLDKETNLYYLYSRYYDPEIGRFLSADRPDYLEPESINGLNLYAYCNNNPVMYCDPSGHSVTVAGIIIGIIIGAIIGGLIGGTIAGVTAALNGASIGGIIASTLLGILFGALIGAMIGAVVVVLSPAIGAGASAIAALVGGGTAGTGTALAGAAAVGVGVAAVGVGLTAIKQGAIVLGSIVSR